VAGAAWARGGEDALDTVLDGVGDAEDIVRRLANIGRPHHGSAVALINAAELQEHGVAGGEGDAHEVGVCPARAVARRDDGLNAHELTTRVRHGGVSGGGDVVVRAPWRDRVEAGADADAGELGSLFHARDLGLRLDDPQAEDHIRGVGEFGPGQSRFQLADERHPQGREVRIDADAARREPPRLNPAHDLIRDPGRLGFRRSRS